jgi:rRNA-processing protein FCF1
MRQVILDTNFLVYCAENKIDYAHEIMMLMNEGHELVVPSSVIKELEEIYKTGEKLSDRSAAFLAIKILQANNVKILPSREKYADGDILNKVRMGSIVATLDLELRNKLRNSRVIVIHGKKKLAFE